MAGSLLGQALMTDDNTPFLGSVALIAAASGARSMTGIATVARVRAAQADAAVRKSPEPRIVPRLERRFDRTIANVTTTLAVFELMADKAPGMPDRTDAGPLFGRVAAGAIVGASVAQMTGRDRKTAAIGGAVAAFAGAHIAYHLRKSLMRHMPAFAAALVEDAAVIALARAGAMFLSDRRTPSALASAANE